MLHQNFKFNTQVKIVTNIEMGYTIKTSIQRAVIDFLPISRRVMTLKFDSKPFKLNIIQVYAPISNSNDDELNSIYGDVREGIRSIK